MKRRIALVCALALPGLCSAAPPAIVGQIDAGAAITQLRVSADGKLAVAFLQPSGDLPWGIRVIDTTVPEKPVLRGFIGAASPGRVVMAPDGRQALLLTELEKGAFDTETRHEIVAIDLSNPDAPKPSWRREILAREVVLADDASVYAASQRSKTREGWQTTISWASGEHPDAVLDEVRWSEPHMRFSEGARFLVSVQFNNRLRILDLREIPSVLYEQGYTGYSRYDCIAAILESGHVVVEDTRVPRLGVYAPKADIPRIATLTHDGNKHCERLGIGAEGSLILAAEIGSGRVYRLDVRDPGNPSFGGSWQFPVRTYPLAVAGALAYAAAGEHGRQVQIFRLDVAGLAAVDWAALEAAHRAAMDRYTQELQAGKPAPHLFALGHLEQAGVRQALRAPVQEISAQRAAAIFNDYGVLASKSGTEAASAEPALRRALELDPNRALAALNLADVLRSRLSAMTDISAKQRQVSEIQALYSKYLDLGGKSNARIESFMKGGLARSADGDICSAIARYTDAGLLQEWVAQSATNIKAGDRRIDIAFAIEGTAHVPMTYAFDADTDFPLDEDTLSVPEDDLWGGDRLGLIDYGDTAHILQYRDFRHPVATWPLSAGPSCRFKTHTVERVGPGAVEPELCRSLSQSRGPAAIEFKAPAPIERDTVSERYSETSAGSMRALDFANNGKPENILELALSSSAGAGCDEMFYDVVDKAGQRFASSSKRDLLMKLQNADPSNRYPMLPCGNRARFFVYHGKVYFENKSAAWPPADNWNQYHRVARVDRGRIVDVCDFRFETTIALER
jgi:hypothetical protein